MQQTTRQLRRRQARRRGLTALGLIAAVALLAGVVAALVRGGAGGDGLASSAATSPAAGSRSSSAAPPSVRVVSGGDVMPDRAVEAYVNANGADAVLQGIAGMLQKGDAAWVNLEGVTSTLGTPETAKDYTFEGPPSFAPALAGAGVDVVTMGNNHSVDYGRAALKDTIERLEQAGVQVVGAGRDIDDAHAPAIVKTEAGATIGFVGYSDVWWPGFEATSSRAGVAQASVDIARMKRDVRALSAQVDYVVAGFHWGYEYQHYPVGQQTKEAHAAIDAGADLVIGHHPHVLQGFETYRGRLIAYSLGDLVFDHIAVETGQTVLVDATLRPDGVSARLVPAYVSSSGIPSLQHGAAARTILGLVKEYSAPLGASIKVDGDVGYVRAGTD